ncbi:200 kDa antigen p200, putative [Burkholderia pseudomallei 1710b]|uniref:200 kDa antigen p200, putative n=1 Tax=Burkholderia pseudomallei (strain 1710b) TaxID=320372 RepID=Q3JUL6_BURP1|nr:200 kDa antigen p200, putative [Burkholderia pseudomallei 1710b]
MPNARAAAGRRTRGAGPTRAASAVLGARVGPHIGRANPAANQVADRTADQAAHRTRIERPPTACAARRPMRNMRIAHEPCPIRPRVPRPASSGAARVEDRLREHARHEPPECRADRQQREAGGGHHERDERGFALARVLHRVGEAAHDRAEQRERGHRYDERLRQRAEERGDRRAEHTRDEIERAAPDGRRVALRAIVVRLGAGADRGRDRGEVDSVRAERREHDGRDARRRDERRRRRGVAVRAQHRDAGHVLRRHRDDEQRNADAHDRRDRERRRREHGPRERDVKAAEVEQAERARGRDARGERRDDRIARRRALDDQVREEHREHERGLELRGAEDLDADLEQDAGEEGSGDAGRNPAHQRVEQAARADGGEQQRADDERADRVRIRDAGQRRDEERRAGRRPRDDDRRAIPQRQPDRRHGHADRQRPDPRRDLRVAQVRGAAGLEHQHERARIARHHRDEARDERGRRRVGEKIRSRGGARQVGGGRLAAHR